MSAPSITSLVDRGIELVAEIAARQKELKEIEEKLRGAAGDRSDQHVPLKADEREGRQFLARGSKLIVPVVFTADKLVGSFQKDGKEHLRIAMALPAPELAEHFKTFFKPWSGFENRFEDGHKFRLRASDLLGNAAPAFLSACLARDKDGLPKSDVKIEWKHAAAEAKLGELALAQKAPSRQLVPGAATSEAA